MIVDNSTTIKVQARAACVVGNEVWLAKQQGGIAIVSVAANHELLAEYPRPSDSAHASPPQVSSLTPVLEEVWASTIDGDLLCINAEKRKTLETVRLPGSQKKASLAHVDFNGRVVLVASAAGMVFVVHPITRKVLRTMSTLAPCTFATYFFTYVAAGDTEGRLYLSDLMSGEQLCIHAESSSEVRHMLFEPLTGALWVARQNKNVDIYKLTATGELSLTHRVASVGVVTGMIAVCGKVILSTLCKKLVTVSAQSPTILDVTTDKHRSFIHGMVKVQCTETASLWSMGNDDAIHVAQVDGFTLPVNAHRQLHPREQVDIMQSLQSELQSENATLGVDVQRAKAGMADLTIEIRDAREEAHELRLRSLKLEEMIQVKDSEIGKKDARIKELTDQSARLQKDVTDVTSRLACAERERGLMQDDLRRTQDDLSRARAESSARLTEKSHVDMSLSREKTDRIVLEQRLRDTEGKLSSTQAEFARLCQSVGNVNTAQNTAADVQRRLLETNAASRTELDQARKLNEVLSSMLCSMEYTIRRREEEEKDLGALLNAYRRKVADHVTDAHLGALLVATMVKHPERFDMECDEATKAMLRNRNGPFIQFIHSLQASDPEAYEKLMQYLQNPSTSDSMTMESRAVLDQFIRLASRDGNVGFDAVQTLKRSIPTAVHSSVPMVPGGAAAAAAASVRTASPTTVNVPPSVGAYSSAPTTGYSPLPPLPSSLPSAGGAVGSAINASGINPPGINIPGSNIPGVNAPLASVGAPTGLAGLVLPITGSNNAVPAPGSMTVAPGAAQGQGISSINTANNNVVSSSHDNNAQSSTGPSQGEITAYLATLSHAGGGPDGSNNTPLMRDIRSQMSFDSSYLKEQRSMFEFVLSTRRALAECLALLHKRAASAQQAVEAMSANTGMSSSTPLTPSASARSHHVPAQVVDIVRELNELASSIVARFLTNAEKQRLS